MRRTALARPVLTALAILGGAIFPLSPAWSAGPDISAPVVVSFDFSPKKIDVEPGSQVVTLTAHVTDDTGIDGNRLISLMASQTTTQTTGLIFLNRLSGDAKDGIYQGSATMQTGIAPGAWRVVLYPVSDTLGNSGSFTEHPDPLMVRYGDSVPNAPTGVTATASPGAATVSWTAPESDLPITGYTVTTFPGGITKQVDGSTTSTTVSGLTNGTAYQFAVVATSSVGDSVPSPLSIAVTPATTPGAPTGLTAVALNGGAQLTWTPPADNGGSAITGYEVTVQPGGALVSIPGNVTSSKLSGLTNGVAYTFTVSAKNALGKSQPSEASAAVTPVGPPATVGKPKAKVTGRTVVLTWVAPATDGVPVTGYRVSWARGSKQVGPTQTTLKLKLKPGTYYISVQALSDAGASPSSPAVRVKVK